MSEQLEALTKSEEKRLQALETAIEGGLNTALEVWDALWEIREKRLYRKQFRTFDVYCRERWRLSKTHVNRLIRAAEISADLAPMGAKPNERQARALTPLDPEQRREAWGKAAAEDPSPTAERLSELTNEALAALPPEKQKALVEAAEGQVMKKAPARQVGGAGQKDRLDQAKRLFKRLVKVVEGFGDSAEEALAHLSAAGDALERIPLD